MNTLYCVLVILKKKYVNQYTIQKKSCYDKKFNRGELNAIYIIILDGSHSKDGNWYIWSETLSNVKYPDGEAMHVSILQNFGSSSERIPRRGIAASLWLGVTR